MNGDLLRSASLFALAPIWLLVGGLLLAALLNGEGELASLCLAVLALVALARTWSRTARHALRAVCRTDRTRLFPGEPLTLELGVHNRCFLPVWVQAAPPLAAGLAPGDRERPSWQDTALFWRQSAHFRWSLRAERRGVHRLESGDLAVADLLGWFPRAQPPSDPLEVIVYPRLVPLRQPVPAARQLFGDRRSGGPVPDPVYLVGTRDYQAGRPARFINWQASARHQRWQEKVCEPSAQASVLLALDVAGYADPEAGGEFEAALEVVASLVAGWHRAGIPVRLVTNGALTGRAAGAAGLRDRPEAILEALARLRSRAEGPLLPGLAGEMTALPEASLVHGSRRFDQATRAVADLARRRRCPSRFLVSQAPEPSAERAGQAVATFAGLRLGEPA